MSPQALVPPDPFIADIDVDLEELYKMPPNEIWVGRAQLSSIRYLSSVN